MKRFLLGFLSGAVMFTALGVIAVEYNIFPNTYKILVDGNEADIEAYNINNKTYLQLRDLGNVFNNIVVDFKEDTILIDTPVTNANEVGFNIDDYYTYTEADKLLRAKTNFNRSVKWTPTWNDDTIKENAIVTILDEMSLPIPTIEVTEGIWAYGAYTDYRSYIKKDFIDNLIEEYLKGN